MVVLSEQLRGRAPGNQMSHDPLRIMDLDFGEDRIVGYIASGSFGHVYRAESKGGKTPWAFKFLDPELLKEPTTVAHFRQEGERNEIAALKDIPGVVRYHHLRWLTYPSPRDQKRTLPYWVMDFVEGETLDKVLWPDGAKKPCPPTRCVRIAYQVAKILYLARAKGVIHCDIKPNNIMIQRKLHDGLPDQEFICITDWATAIRIGDQYRKASQSFHQGNADYAPPERILGVPNEKYDVYSVALILFEMLAGRRPRGRTIVHESYKEEFFKDSGIEPHLQNILVRCVYDEPSARPSMRELAVELLRWLQDDCRTLSRWLDTEAEKFGQERRWHREGPRSSLLRPAAKVTLGVLLLAGAGIVANQLKNTNLHVEPDLAPGPPGPGDAAVTGDGPGTDGGGAVSDAGQRDQASPRDLLDAQRLCWQLQSVAASGIGSSSLTLYDVWGAGRRSLYVSGQYAGQGVVLSSKDVGATWQSSVVPQSAVIYAGWATANNREIYAVGASSTILKSNDGGISWDARPANISALNLMGIWGTPTGDALYVVGAMGTILESLDHGESWHPAYDTSPSQATLRGIWGSDRGDLWVVSLSGEILHGQQGPSGWRWQLGLNVQAEGWRLYDIWGSGPQLHAVGSRESPEGGAIFSSIDGGQSWHRREVREGLLAVSGDGPALYAAGTGRTEGPLRAQPTDWQPERIELKHIPRRLRGLWGRGERLYAVGDQGVLFSHQACGGP